MRNAVIVHRYRYGLGIGRPRGSALQIERIGHDSSVPAVVLHYIHERPSVLQNGESDRSSVAGDRRAAQDLCSLAIPQFRGSLVGDFPDALAASGCRNIKKIVGSDAWGESVPVVNGIRAAADISTGESASGNRQRVLLVVSSVATRRRPSVVAASEVYRSRPEVSR